MKYVILSIIVSVFISLSGNFLIAQDALSEILQSELEREWKTLSQQEEAPYYLCYRVDEEFSNVISANLGNIEKVTKSHDRTLSTSIRLGSFDLDNYHEIRGRDGFRMYSGGTKIPIEDNKDAISQIIWNETNKAYNNGLKKLAKVKANVAVKVEEEDKAPDFSEAKPNEYFEESLPSSETSIDIAQWKQKVKAYSNVFLESHHIYEGSARISQYVIRKYFVDSDGSNVVHNFKYARLMISGEIKAEDGMVLPLYESYFAFDIDDLPDDETILADTRNLVRKLEELRLAPVVEPYSGPALMSGAASGVFFHEIFGHRVEGQRQKSESDGQTFKKKIGELVLPSSMSVIFDPTLDNHQGDDLYGFYRFDDQGQKGEKVTVVENGVLKSFLMSRTPINNFPKSNGHGRAYKGRDPVARQSNLIVETSTQYTEEELRKMLIDEVKNQNKEFAYYFKNVTGGFTMTGRYMPNAFNVQPTEVYKIFVDGRPDQLVRGVDLVGTPLTMFSEVEAGGGNTEIFTGNCGAESGWVPVTSISPSLFVKQIELQKKSKSQEKPVVLPRPDQEK